ncbi:MAG TPA: BACON domain-containing protein [Flavisolibacter sp.]|nr:BACON domain-containing protein [Flavisolibacter sp.]
MKLLSALLLVFITSFVLVTACKKHDKPATLSTDKTTLNIAAAAVKDSVQISASGDWTITGLPSWASLSSASGNSNGKVVIIFSANTALTARTATLTLRTVLHHKQPL